ncbi:MAG: hypothetical protein ACOX1T_03650 [Saccharofermentanales bacterium]
MQCAPVDGELLAAPDLPPSDVLIYTLENGIDWFCVRPSGTEPKIKIYFGFYGKDKAELEARLAETRATVEAYIRTKL